MTEIIRKIFWGTVLFSIILVNPMSTEDVYAGKRTTRKITRTIELKGEKHLTVKMDIGAGIIDLRRNRTGDILIAEVEYDPDELEVEIKYDADKDEGTLYLESDSKRKGIDLDKEDHYWNLEFTDKIPITFEIDVGACEADLDFTGLKIDRLDMDLGASSVDVDFREPNPVRIHKISIDVGASALTIIGLGNANFDRFSFDGGIGDFTLDFSGDFKHRARVDIDVGLGSLTIRLPKDAGVEIKSESSFLSSFSIDKGDFDEVEDDLYQSNNFGETDKELIFDVDIGLGSIDIECIDR
ncbi:MAG: toast rack family protein [Candidatus Zixiibacteriota bacterium]